MHGYICRHVRALADSDASVPSKEDGAAHEMVGA